MSKEPENPFEAIARLGTTPVPDIPTTSRVAKLIVSLIRGDAQMGIAQAKVGDIEMTFMGVLVDDETDPGKVGFIPCIALLTNEILDIAEPCSLTGDFVKRKVPMTPEKMMAMGTSADRPKRKPRRHLGETDDGGYFGPSGNC